MIATLFADAFDNQPQAREVDWAGLVDLIGTHRQPRSKLEAPAISPAEYPPGKTRSVRSVRRIHFAMLDFDGEGRKGLTQAELEQVLQTAAGLRLVLYTSWSHAKVAKQGRWKIRLVIDLSRPIEREEWADFWVRLHALFGELGDTQCKESARMYFLPSAPDAQGLVEEQDGEPLDVDAVLALPLPELRKGSAKQVVGPGDLTDLAGRLARRHSAAAKEAGAAIRDCLSGTPPAAPGGRDNALFRVACYVAQEWPDASPEAMAGLLRPGIDAMCATSVTGDCPGVEDLARKIERQQDRVRTERIEAEAERREQQGGLILDAFDGLRSHPYTPDELDSYAAEAGVDREAFARRWIVQAGRSYYLCLAGGYVGPYCREELVPAADRILAAASTAGVDVWRATKEGAPAPKTPQQLMLDYGSVAREVIVELGAARGTFDGRTLTEAPCPMTSEPPEFDPQIQTWLEAFGGDDKSLFLDWLASVPKLDQPCAALYLEGPPGVGKTLLACGLAQVWKAWEPTSLKHVVGFNEALLRCPLILADEVIPEALKRGEGTGFLRQIIQARTHTLNRKFLPTATVRGSVRLILAANNKYLLDDSEVLTEDDVAAIVERFVYLKVPPEARTMLEAKGLAKKIADGGLAKHVLWLAQHREISTRGRFLVAGATSELHRALTVGRGLGSAICHWLVGYLLEPGKLDSQKQLLARIEDEALLVNARAFSQYWDLYPTNTKPPVAGHIKRALTSICEPGYVQRTSGNGKATNYRRVKTEDILTWNRELGYVGEDEILDALQKETPGAVDDTPF